MHALVIEDEGMAAMLAIEYLHDAGYSVSHASTTDEAVTLAGEQDPDIVLTDWNVDGSSSVLEVVKAIRRHNPKVAVAFVTGRSEEGLAVELESVKPYLFFVKPVDLEMVIKSLVAASA